GDGSFQPAVSYAAGADPAAVALGDFTGNGTLDLAVANETPGMVSVLLGNGNGSFQAPMSYPAGGSPLAVAVGDFNGNGFPDLTVAHKFSGTVTVLRNAADWGAGPHSRPAPHATPTPHRDALGQPPLAFLVAPFT